MYKRQPDDRVLAVGNNCFGKKAVLVYDLVYGTTIAKIHFGDNFFINELMFNSMVSCLFFFGRSGNQHKLGVISLGIDDVPNLDDLSVLQWMVLTNIVKSKNQFSNYQASQRDQAIVNTFPILLQQYLERFFFIKKARTGIAASTMQIADQNQHNTL